MKMMERKACTAFGETGFLAKWDSAKWDSAKREDTVAYTCDIY